MNAAIENGLEISVLLVAILWQVKASSMASTESVLFDLTTGELCPAPTRRPLRPTESGREAEGGGGDLQAGARHSAQARGAAAQNRRAQGGNPATNCVASDS